MAASARPVIGITCYEEEATWGNWETVASVLPIAYVRAVVGAGGVPLLVPPQELTAAEAADLVARLDGLCFAGGGDVAPDRYGEEPHEHTVPASGPRDALELAVLEAAMSGEVPTLAICRGLQVLNVARGGTLVQHLPDAVGHEGHRPTPGHFGAHDVSVRQGSKLAGLLGWERASVPTHHHQAIGTIGDGLEASAHADDGIVEAVEDPGLPFLVGVQWHPEAGEDAALFDALIEAARSWRETR